MMMKKSGSKTNKYSLEHVDDYDAFIKDEELRNKYSIEINRITYSPYNIMNFDEFVASEKKWEDKQHQEDRN